MPFCSKDIFLDGEHSQRAIAAIQCSVLTLVAACQRDASVLGEDLLRSLDVARAEELTTIKGDIFLSPLCRLLADTPGPAERVMDGRGHKLVLPAGVDAQERLPLILVGAGNTLQLRNITIVHSSSLAACLHLAAGTYCATPGHEKRMSEQPVPTTHRSLT